MVLSQNINGCMTLPRRNLSTNGCEGNLRELLKDSAHSKGRCGGVRTMYTDPSFGNV
jgi:hypothetical protein